MPLPVSDFYRSLADRAVRTLADRDLENRILIQIGSATCEHAAGSQAVAEEFIRHIRASGRKDIVIHRTGCTGRCCARAHPRRAPARPAARQVRAGQPRPGPPDLHRAHPGRRAGHEACAGPRRRGAARARVPVLRRGPLPEGRRGPPRPVPGAARGTRRRTPPRGRGDHQLLRGLRPRRRGRRHLPPGPPREDPLSRGLGSGSARHPPEARPPRPGGRPPAGAGGTHRPGVLRALRRCGASSTARAGSPCGTRASSIPRAWTNTSDFDGFKALAKALEQGRSRVGHRRSDQGPGSGAAAAAASSPASKWQFGPPTRGDHPLHHLQRRRGRSGRLHGPRHARERPLQRRRGHDHRRLRHRRLQGLLLHPRRVPAGHQAHPERHRRSAGRAGLLGERHHGLRLRLRPGDPARRRRLRLRRGDGPHPLHRRRAGPAAACGRPTPRTAASGASPPCINNVETFANVTAIINFGGDWFARIGTEDSGGTKVFALAGKVQAHGPRGSAPGHARSGRSSSTSAAAFRTTCR